MHHLSFLFNLVLLLREDDVGPGVLGRGPGAGPLRLDPKVVDAPGQPEEAVLAPVGAPGVADDPVLLTVLLAVAHHGDVVVDVRGVCIVREDPT